MHGGLLGRRGGVVDADVVADQVLLLVLAEALVGVDQPAGALVADLAVVRESSIGVVGLGVRVRRRAPPARCRWSMLSRCSSSQGVLP